MAYIVTYDDDYLFDPYSSEDVIYDASVSGEVNAAGYFDFSITSEHRLYNTIEERAGIVKVYSDNKMLFMGEISDIEEDFYGNKTVSCVDPRDHLNDVMVRPYSTIEGEQNLTAPSSVDGYFQWLIDQYNKGMINPKFHFQVGINQGAYMDKDNYIYRSSEDFPTVGAEIEDQILDSLGGYLTLTYPDGIPTLNLYSDVHEANTQIIDFGVNLIDFTKTTATSEQYTAIRPEGGTPDKEESDSDNLVEGTRDWSQGRGSGVKTEQKYMDFTVLMQQARSSEILDAGSWNVGRVQSEEKYTLSFYMRTDNPGVNVYSYFYPGTVASGSSSQGSSTTAADGKILIKPTEAWARYTITWTTLKEIQKESGEGNTQQVESSIIVSRLDKQTDGSKVYIAGVKFEQNATATAWSPASEDDGPPPITIESLGDGVTSVDSDYVKKGDVVYCLSAVNRYGYKEYNWQEGSTLDKQELLEKAVADLKKVIAPKLTLEVKAVDMALFMDGYDHLECGQVARVRSLPHGVDEYLLISSMDIDLKDPSQTTYTLGQAFDSLTGEQSSFVKSLNAGINSSLDAVAGLTTDVKNSAIKIDQVGNAVTEVGNKADNALNISNEASQAAQDAWDKANSAQNAADQANKDLEEVHTWIDDYEGTVADVTAIVNQIQIDMGETETKLNETASKAQEASDKADALVDDIENVNTSIEGLDGEIEGLKVTVEAAKSTADSAVSQVAQTKTDLEGFKTSVSQNYSTKKELDDAIAQEVLDRNAALKVGLDGISATVSENYTELTEKVADAQGDATTALQAAQSAAEDLTNFSEEISGTLGDLQSQIDGSVQTWFYSGVPTLANAPANEWTDSATRNNHLGDLYYDTTTGYAYRFMLQNGTYSWSRITDSDVTKALQDAAKAQDTADHKRRVFVTTPKPPYDVGDLWVQGSGGDIKRCQTAKTSAQSYTAADWILASKYTDDTKADAVEDALNAYKKTVTNTYSTKAELTTTKNSILGEVSETYTSKEVFNSLEIGTKNLLKFTAYDNDEGYSERGTVYKASVDTANSYGGRPSLKIVGSAAAVSGSQDVWQYLWNPLINGKKLMLSFYVKGSVATKMWIRIGGGGSASNGTSSPNAATAISVTTSWQKVVFDMGTAFLNDNGATTEVIYGFGAAGTFYMNGMMLEYGTKASDWSQASEDLTAYTDDVIAQEVIDRNAAIKVESTAIKQSVSQTYATKDALADTNASITTTANQIRSEVSAKYATREEINQTNRIENPRFITNTAQWTAEKGTLTRHTGDAFVGSYATAVTASRFYYNFPASAGQVWTSGITYEYSFFAKCNTTGGTLRPSRSLIDYSSVTHSIGTTWKKFSGTIECKATVASGGSLSFSTNGNSRTFYITDVYLAPLDYTSVYSSKSYVDQKADSITSTVESNYNSLNNKFGSYYTKTQIDQQKDSIESSIKVAVDNIDVGAKNMLRDSDTPNRAHNPSSYPAASYNIQGGVTSGEQYTWTIHGTFTNATKAAMYFTGGTYGTKWIKIPGNGTHTIHCTFTADSNMVNNDSRADFYVRDSRNQASFNGTAVISWAKLEKGNKPTDWSPAPEDVETELTSIRQDLDSIDLKVADLDGNQSDFQVTVNGFESRLKTAESNASTAKNNASTALSTANTAKSTADSAKSTATTANNTANTAKSTADSAKSTANTANSTANTAKSTADSAKTTATNAQNTANAAKKQVYHSAAGTSGTAGYVRFATVKFTGAYMNRPVFFALSNRGQAQSNVWIQWASVNSTDPALSSIKADGGINVYVHKTATSTWEVVAQKSEGYDTIYVNDYSNNNASCAVSWVNVHLSSVSGFTGATRIAAKRNSADIDNAAKTATNYLKFDSTGLTVGNVSGTLQGNTHMTSNAVEVRNGTTVLSSFGASTIELGKNSTSSVVKMCGGKAVVQYTGSRLHLGGKDAYIDINPGTTSGSERSSILLHSYATNGTSVDWGFFSSTSTTASQDKILRMQYKLKRGDGSTVSDDVEAERFVKQACGPTKLWSGNLAKGGAFTLSSNYEWDDFRIFGVTLGADKIMLLGAPYAVITAAAIPNTQIHFSSGADGGHGANVYIASINLTGLRTGQYVAGGWHNADGTGDALAFNLTSIYGIC